MNTQICTQCGIEKEVSLFHKRKDTKSGVRKNCKDCCNSKRMESVDVGKKSNYDKEYYRKNRDTRIAQTTKYQKNNPEKVCAIASKRRAKLLERTPKWLGSEDFEIMEWAYEWAKELSDKYSVNFEVDHIIPLQGKYVSGFHCPENLQVITAHENRCKSNKFNMEVA